MKRNCHASVTWNNKLIVLGGYDGKGISSDAITYDFVQKSWLKIPVNAADSSITPARYAHKAALVGNDIYIFGGYAEDKGWLNDLCTIHLEADVTLIIFNLDSSYYRI